MDSKYCKIIHLSEVSSTNEYAKALLKKEKPQEGTAVVTDYQTAGKGQDSNTWESEAGNNILISMILYPDFLEPAKQFNISKCVALGITDFLKELLNKSVKIKWPNDIYWGNGKLGGILINNEIMGDRFAYVVAGIGLNVNQVSFSPEIPNPTSVKIITGKEYDPGNEALRLCDCVRMRYESLRLGEFERIDRDYLDSLMGLNEERNFIYKGSQIKARITGVNEYGHLLLETEDETIECDIKEITYLL